MRVRVPGSGSAFSVRVSNAELGIICGLSLSALPRA